MHPVFGRPVFLFVLFCLVAPLSWPGSLRHQDSAWKRYLNRELGYCVEYPARWQRGDAFEGAGMYFETGVKKYSRPLGEIDIIAVSDADLQPRLTTVEYLQDHLEGLRKFERAQRITILDRHEIQLLGAPALLLKDSYFDPQDGGTWVDKVVLARSGDRLFRLELECSAATLPRFEPVFDRFVRSFQFNCNGKGAARRP
ncbi:MAG: hypothetical protein INR62_04045 [Rhodospirillales bacterium]|nr:hypothetical protein [Acetobacter sp.]